jgi:dimethylargininase
MFPSSNAICREISPSLVEEAQRLDDGHQPIDPELMQKQHRRYVETLKAIGLNVIVLPGDAALPDCVFTEDAAVCCDRKAIVTRLGHASRRQEHVEMRKALESLNLEIFDMTLASDENAFCDGGDVLFTGKEFFVGHSKRTTPEGAKFIQSAFGYPTHSIKVYSSELHLKSNCTMLCPGKIVFSGENLRLKFVFQTDFSSF